MPHTMPGCREMVMKKTLSLFSLEFKVGGKESKMTLSFPVSDSEVE